MSLDPSSVGVAGPDSIEDDIESQLEETDELLEAVTAQGAANAAQFQALNERITECLTRTEQLATQSTTTENPLLTQLLSLTAELKGELTNLKSSVELIQNRLTESRLTSAEVVEETPVVVLSDVEGHPEAVENPPQKPPRKNRFI